MNEFDRHLKGGKLDEYGFFERKIFKKTLDDMKITISKHYHKRPDKLAYDIYGNQGLIWFVLQYNDMLSIDEFVEGSKIELPSPKNLNSGLI